MKCKYCAGAGTIILVKATANTKTLSMSCSKCRGTGNIETWYEVYINKGEEGTESIYKTENKMEAIRFVAKYNLANKQRAHLDRWELDKNNTPYPVEEIL